MGTETKHYRAIHNHGEHGRGTPDDFLDFRIWSRMQAERKRKKIYLIVLKRDGIGIGELPYEIGNLFAERVH